MQEKERLNKFLSEAGICSRREADRMIMAGAVTVNGEPAETGMRVSEEDTVLVRGKKIRKKEEMVLLLMNKPRGIICTAQTREKPNIIEYLNYPVRVYPVGRLDKESEGLLLLTNNGDLVNRIMRAGNFHEKEYHVWVNRPIDQEFIRRMSDGVPILDTVTRPCKVRKTGKNTFSIILTQGLNRQIRRMCEYLGYRVERLVRVRIMNLRLDGIDTGEYRKITDQEYRKLQKLLKDSTSLPWKEKL
ncbi:pseudouridine synthase [Ruminococcus sp. OA3]|uniref:pseudouridine synthase n=1 Tax=Ruminococcus sp. OA3 TaxID=2914164 RepID=UPI001F056833|nr:pseudouridine synthase [Ruminococcus sp. OA3]MCH1982706.1 pseudouridine synthase [Ruminococcus sp. OA3]